jgi:peptidoglycan/LPS O-acetylase OafA/YrhL
MPLPAGGAAKRPTIAALTGLRFLIALSVVLHHFRFGDLMPWPAILEPLIAHRLGVSSFFILSGFVLVYQYADWFRDGLGRFADYARARVARMVPLHLATLVLATPIALWAGDPTIPPARLVQSWLANLTMVHAFNQAGVFHYWNLPSWSVSALMGFSLVFPVFVRTILARARGLGGLVALGLLVYALEIAGFLIALVIVGQRPGPFDAGAFQRFLFMPLLRVWEFFFGCVAGALFLHTLAHPESRLAMGLRARRWREGLAIGAVAALLLLAVVTLALRPADRLSWTWAPYVPFTPLVASLLLALAAGPTLLSRLLARRWLVRLGEASYSLYLIHWLPLAILLRFAEQGHRPPPVLSLLALAGVVLVSLASHTFIEQPARRWVRGWRLPLPARHAAVRQL